MIEQLHRPSVAEMPEEAAAIAATLEPHLMEHPAGGIAVDLGMAGDDIAQLDAEDVSVANRSQLVDQPPELRPQTGGPRLVEQRLERLEVRPHPTRRHAGLVHPLGVGPQPGGGELQKQPGHRRRERRPDHLPRSRLRRRRCDVDVGWLHRRRAEDARQLGDRPLGGLLRGRQPLDDLSQQSAVGVGRQLDLDLAKHHVRAIGRGTADLVVGQLGHDHAVVGQPTANQPQRPNPRDLLDGDSTGQRRHEGHRPHRRNIGIATEGHFLAIEDDALRRPGDLDGPTLATAMSQGAPPPSETQVGCVVVGVVDHRLLDLAERRPRDGVFEVRQLERARHEHLHFTFAHHCSSCAPAGQLVRRRTATSPSPSLTD